MRVRLLLAATAAITLAACSDMTTAPHKLSPPQSPRSDMMTCRTGYHIATRSDGTEYCEADGGAQMTATTTTKK